MKNKDNPKGNIIVVDDTAENLHVLTNILIKEGYEVRATTNGARALASINVELPDLILLDIKMPGMSGYEICEKLKANYKTKDIPVIFMSALNDEIDKVKAFSLGGVDYITKPFHIEETLSRIKTHIKLFRLNEQMRKQNEEIEKANEKFRLIFENASYAILWIEPKTDLIVNCNNMANNLLNRSKEEIIGKSQNILYPPEKVELYLNIFQKNFKKKHTFSEEVEIITKTGNIRIAEISAVIITIDNEPIIQAIFRDITTKREVEKKLQETTAQLIQVEKLTAIGDMAAGIAHEINQPLNVINIIIGKTMRQIQKIEFVKENIIDIFQTISSQVKKISDIIDHMRIYFRNTDVTIQELIDINELINGALIFFEAQLRLNNIDIIKKYKENLPQILGDQIRLEQAIINLITNARFAVDVSKQSNKIIEIGAYMSKEGVVIYIKDNGIGIPELNKHKIFNPFFTTKEIGKGIGLGLHVTKKIIDEHKGKIEFISQENIGTTFNIILPPHL